MLESLYNAKCYWYAVCCAKNNPPLRQRTLDEGERLRARERGQEAERQLKQRKLLRLEAAPKAGKPGAASWVHTAGPCTCFGKRHART